MTVKNVRLVVEQGLFYRALRLTERKECSRLDAFMVSPAPLVSGSPSVLIVEDEPIVAAHQASIMEEAGYKVVASTCDAEAALVAADEAPPDVAIVDVRLAGGIDGLTVGRELRRRHGTAIVFVTGQLEQAVRQIHDIGAVFVGKPFADREVLGAVRDALRQRAAH